MALGCFLHVVFNGLCRSAALLEISLEFEFMEFLFLEEFGFWATWDLQLLLGLFDTKMIWLIFCMLKELSVHRY